MHQLGTSTTKITSGLWQSCHCACTHSSLLSSLQATGSSRTIHVPSFLGPEDVKNYSGSLPTVHGLVGTQHLSWTVRQAEGVLEISMPSPE